MIREMVAFGRNAWEFVREEHKAGALLLAGFIALILFASSQLWSDVEAALTHILKVRKFALYLGLLTIGLFSLLLYIFVHRERIIRKMRPGQGIEIPPPGERLRIEPIDTLAKLRQIQEVLVPAIFGSDTPPDEEVYRSFAKNPRRSIGLYSDDLCKFVGFATIWPITEEAAIALKSGQRVEEELTAADILPAAENKKARYAVIPGIGVIGSTNEWGKRRGLKLLLAFSNFIHEEYLKGRGRSIELIASGWSDNGRALCASMEMTLEGEFSHGGKSYPLFVKKIDAKSLRAGELKLV